eukprot:scaffold824_cov327-Pavlova_lutheri.AAC.32
MCACDARSRARATSDERGFLRRVRSRDQVASSSAPVYSTVSTVILCQTLSIRRTVLAVSQKDGIHVGP